MNEYNTVWEVFGLVAEKFDIYSSAYVGRVAEQFTTLVFNKVSYEYEKDCDRAVICISMRRTTNETALIERWFIENFKNLPNKKQSNIRELRVLKEKQILLKIRFVVRKWE